MLTAWIAATQMVAGLSRLKPRSRMIQRLLGMTVPLLFGSFLFFLWEVLVRGFGVPAVLMPAPSVIAERFATSLPTLAADFVQTFLRGVLADDQVAPLSGQGSHQIAALGRATALIVIPEETTELAAGETVDVLILP